MAQHLDCSHISQAKLQEASDCMDLVLSSELQQLINMQRTAYTRLNDAIALELRPLGPFKSSVNKANRAVKKFSNQSNRTLRTCLRQNPANVCFRQKAMQSFWIALPKVMAEVSKIFSSGFNASSQSKALKYLDKQGIKGQEANDILAQFAPGTPGGMNPNPNAGSGSGRGPVGAAGARYYPGQTTPPRNASTSSFPVIPAIAAGAFLLLILRG